MQEYESVKQQLEKDGCRSVVAAGTAPRVLVCSTCT